MKKIIVVGGVAAGMSAASKAARACSDADIVVYTQENYISYSACSLPYLAQGTISNKEELIARTPEQMLRKGVRVLTGHTCVSIDTQNRTVKVKNGEGSISEDTYDELIIATGAKPIVPENLRSSFEGVFTVKTIPDIQNIQSFQRRYSPKKAVIIGGGVIGLEMADALISLGLHVTLLEKAPQILTTFDSDMAGLVEDYIRGNGIAVCKECNVTSIEGDNNGRVGAVMTENGSYPAQMVILAVGVLPNSKLAEDAGIMLGYKKAILVDSEMRTSADHVFAAGDCATSHHMVSGKDVYIPLGTTANKQGRIAGENAVGGHKSFAGVMGASIFKIFGWEAAKTGLTMREAAMNDIKAWESVITSNTRASGYPGRGPITVKLVMEDKTNRILGGQIFGAQGAGKRIDVLTAVAQHKAAPDELAQLDMAYAPPFSPVWDPILVAANQAVSAARKRECNGI